MNHKTHLTRYSDSSLYDEVCIFCGFNDSSQKILDEPCTGDFIKARWNTTTYTEQDIKDHLDRIEWKVRA